jgi:hypothetical protein
VSTPTEYPVAVAVVAVLEDALGAGRAGYGSKPTGAGHQTDGTFRTYARVHAGRTTLAGGTAADPNADGVHDVQVTYVGKNATSCDKARDTGRTAVLTTGAVAAELVGRELMGPVELSDSTEPREDDQVQPPQWYAVDRYRIPTTT